LPKEIEDKISYLGISCLYDKIEAIFMRMRETENLHQDQAETVRKLEEQSKVQEKQILELQN